MGAGLHVMLSVSGQSSSDTETCCLPFLQGGATSHEENMHYLNLAVGAFQKVQTQSTRHGRPVKRDSRGQTLEDCGSFPLPFGPHLTPVLCPGEEPQEMRSPERGRAGTARQDASQRLVQSHDGADGTWENFAEAHKEPGTRTITTNDLLECLVHPDVVAQVTQLLLDKHAGNARTGP